MLLWLLQTFLETDFVMRTYWYCCKHGTPCFIISMIRRGRKLGSYLLSFVLILTRLDPRLWTCQSQVSDWRTILQFYWRWHFSRKYDDQTNFVALRCISCRILNLVFRILYYLVSRISYLSTSFYIWSLQSWRTCGFERIEKKVKIQRWLLLLFVSLHIFYILNVCVCACADGSMTFMHLN